MVDVNSDHSRLGRLVREAAPVRPPQRVFPRPIYKSRWKTT